MITLVKPAVGFLGVGWIGKNRLEAAADIDVVDIVALADSSEENCKAAAGICKEAERYRTIGEILAKQPEGLVIATPSALHAVQASEALSKGVAVFCQKPLGRNAIETAKIVNKAKAENLLLGVDFSYRFTCFRQIRELVQNGDLGEIYAVEMCFHNAYGPDKGWFYQRQLSGGGCVMDLGIHLIDLVVWCLNEQKIKVRDARLYHQGKPFMENDDTVEDYGFALMETEEGVNIQMNCSWNLPAGKEAEIYFNIYGTRGGASFRNIKGSFYDFEALKFNGTSAEVLFSGEDSWGGGAIKNWCTQLAENRGFDPEIESAVEVAAIIDKIYETARVKNNH